MLALHYCFVFRNIHLNAKCERFCCCALRAASTTNIPTTWGEQRIRKPSIKICVGALGSRAVPRAVGSMHALDGLHVHPVANPLVAHRNRLRAFSNARPHKGSSRCARQRAQQILKSTQTDTDYRSVVFPICEHRAVCLGLGC